MLTPAQLTSLKTNSATTGAPGIAPTQAMTPEQAHAWIGSSTAQPTDKVTGQPLDGLSKFVQGSVGGAFQSGVDQAKSGYQQAQVATNPGTKLEAGLQEAAGVAGAVFSPIAPVLAPVGAAVNAVADKVSDIPSVQKFATSDAGATASRVAQDVNNTANLLPLGAGILSPKATGAAVKGTIDSAKTGIDAVKDAATPKPPTAEQVKASTAAKVQKVADEWQKPTIPGKATNPASFNKASDVLARSPETPKFLAEQKLNPSEHIENGRYATADSAQALRDTAGKMSNDTLRPSLQMADYSTPKAPVSDIIDSAIKNANEDKSLTPGERTSVIRNITKEGAALSKENPDGLSLTDAHDGKITYAAKAGYSPIKSASDNAIATANRHIASALQKDVEGRAPASIPVKEFNSYLSKYYKGADYLDALDTKKAPVSLLQNIAHRGAQVAGAVIGHHIGGGILGGVGGYAIGGALEHALENMTTPLRSSFLRNLEITNPKAFTKVQDYLKAQNTGDNGMLRLPAANSETPIPLGPDSVTPHIQVNDAARAKLPYADPKTGQMRPRPYTSASAPR